MIGREQINAEELKMQGLLDRYLHSRISAADSAAPHLDEDALNAFAEGRLAPPEASTVVEHLFECSFCLHLSAELLRLEADFSEQEKPFSVPAAEPTKISDVLNNLLAKIFAGGKDAVFAHEEKKETQNADAEEENESDV